MNGCRVKHDLRFEKYTSMKHVKAFGVMLYAILGVELPAFSHNQ